jgi:hypothetical protein
MTQKRRLFLFSLPTEATTNQPRCKVRMWPEMQPRSSRRVKLVFQYDELVMKHHGYLSGSRPVRNPVLRRMTKHCRQLALSIGQRVMMLLQ